jgi:hypothetical protein
VEERRSTWLHAQFNAASVELNMTKEAAIRQIATKATMKATFRKLQPIVKGSRSGAISQIKVPNHTCMYHQLANTLYCYVKGSFYSHSREEMTEGENGPFQIHRTWQPLPKADVT